MVAQSPRAHFRAGHERANLDLVTERGADVGVLSRRQDLRRVDDLVQAHLFLDLFGLVREEADKVGHLGTVSGDDIGPVLDKDVQDIGQLCVGAHGEHGGAGGFDNLPDQIQSPV